MNMRAERASVDSVKRKLDELRKQKSGMIEEENIRSMQIDCVSVLL